MKVIVRRRPGARKTTAEAIRNTLITGGSVLLASRAKVGGYYTLMASRGLRLKHRRVSDGWLVWVEKPEKRR